MASRDNLQSEIQRNWPLTSKVKGVYALQTSRLEGAKRVSRHQLKMHHMAHKSEQRLIIDAADPNRHLVERLRLENQLLNSVIPSDREV